MDPNACFERMINAREAGDEREYQDAWSDLRGWRDGGGFAPDPIVRNGIEYTVEWHPGGRMMYRILRVSSPV